MNFDLIKRNYDRGLWPESLVRMAVRKGLINQEQCNAILTGTEINEDGAITEALAILNGEA